jgi:outer membrane scaffolding protein for murein synthesis (MipA/OmpV family)
MKSISEDARFLTYRIGAHLSWWTAFAWTVALTVTNLTHPEPQSTFQRTSGVLIIFLLAAGVAFSTTVARMRLGKIITAVFETGMRLAARDGRDEARERRDEAQDMRSADQERSQAMQNQRGASQDLRGEAQDLRSDAQDRRGESQDSREVDDDKNPPQAHG